MPRVEAEAGGIEGFKVNHNQNDALSVHEKMIRSGWTVMVCNTW